MLMSTSVPYRSKLLVDNVKNSTNGSIQNIKATELIQNILERHGYFSLLTSQQIAKAKKLLGLLADDSLISRSKAIGLARYLGAQYLLYSNLEGNIKLPTLQIQLILVKSGEIIWSGTSDIKR